MEMIEYQQGDLLKADVEALVNTVNCVGVMGKGIALQFKQAYPDNFRQYERASRAGQIQLGQMFVVPTNRLTNPLYIINFPTKYHWRVRSQLNDIQLGLAALVSEVKSLRIKSIAVPPLGCGNGGLDWSEVKPLIQAAFAELPDVQLLVFEPTVGPSVEEMQVNTKRPKMTRARAMLIQLIELYRNQDYRLTMLEIQKLAYFLQEAGEPLQLDYTRNIYGPYAENLHHALQRLEGHYIRGYGDRSQQSEVYLLPGAIDEANEVLKDDPDALARLSRLEKLIEGFETPYSMELLATVHWLNQRDAQIASDVSAAIEGVKSWNNRKRRVFHADHIKVAWQHLQQMGWLNTATRSE